MLIATDGLRYIIMFQCSLYVFAVTIPLPSILYIFTSLYPLLLADTSRISLYSTLVTSTSALSNKQNEDKLLVQYIYK